MGTLKSTNEKSHQKDKGYYFDSGREKGEHKPENTDSYLNVETSLNSTLFLFPQGETQKWAGLLGIWMKNLKNLVWKIQSKFKRDK